MIVSQQQRKIYRQILCVLLLPALLYVVAALGVTTPVNYLWLPIYILGVVPYIVLDAVFALLHVELLPVVWNMLLAGLQGGLAYVIAQTYLRNAKQPVGTFAGHAPVHLRPLAERLLYTYGILFYVWLIYYAFEACVV